MPATTPKVDALICLVTHTIGFEPNAMCSRYPTMRLTDELYRLPCKPECQRRAVIFALPPSESVP